MASSGIYYGIHSTLWMLLFTHIVNIPIGKYFLRIRSTTTRLYLSNTLGLIWFNLVYDCVSVCAILFVTLLFGSVIKLRAGSPTSLSMAAMIFRSLVHLKSFFIGYDTNRMNVTGTVMLICAKLIMLSHHPSDGISKMGGGTLSPIKHIADHRTRTAITDTPSMVEIVAYISDFQGGLVGPIWAFQEWRDWIYLRGDYENLNTIKKKFTNIFKICKFHFNCFNLFNN
jgi:hypothetical protein